VDLIKLKEVSKSYGKAPVLSKVNLTIEKGDILGVIGQSGSGKTTLLNLVAGFLEPSEGEIVVFSNVNNEERDLNENLHKLKKSIGFTPQHNSFYPKLTVAENMLHFGLLYGMKKDILVINIKNLLKITGLYDHKHKLAEHLSGGMQKRLDISCSLVHKPKTLILDEPTADLDPILQKEILHLIQDVNEQGITIVIASHHLESIEKICNKVAIVHKGKVHTHGLMEEIKKPYLRDHFTISVHSQQNKEELIEKFKQYPIKKIVDKGHSLIIYPEHVGKTVNSLLSTIQEEGLYLHNMDLRKPSLNEIFEDIVLEA